MDELSKYKNSYALAGNMNARYIYHYTNYDSLQNIIKDNVMYTSESGISYSSNPNLYKRGFIFWHSSKYSEGKNHLNTGIKMKFDFNLMKSDNLRFRAGNENMGTHAGEEEIGLMSDELNNVKKYLVEVIIFKQKEKNYKLAEELLKKEGIKYRVV